MTWLSRESACAVFVLMTLAIAGGSSSTSKADARVRSIDDIFAAANSAVSRGEFTEAIARYQELESVGIDDPDVYFNVAIAYAQMGDYPRAIFYCERALALRPFDAEATDNLAAAERELTTRRVEAEGEATIREESAVGAALYRRIPETVLAVGLLVANAVLFFALAWSLVAGRRSGALSITLGLAGAVLVVCALGLAVKAGAFRDGPRAVVLDDTVTLREGPDPRARPRGAARGGDRAEILQVGGEFVRIRIAGGDEGWAPANQVGRI